MNKITKLRKEMIKMIKMKKLIIGAVIFFVVSMSSSIFAINKGVHTVLKGYYGHSYYNHGSRHSYSRQNDGHHRYGYRHRYGHGRSYIRGYGYYGCLYC